MVRAPFYDKNGTKKGAWSEEEDNKLRSYILRYGHWNWRLLPKYAGLARCGKSCRLRWVNYLKPGVKKGSFTKQEEDLIVELHAKLGQKWSAIAERLPGRTDNDIKNFWHTRIQKHRNQKNPATNVITNPSIISSDVEKKHSQHILCKATTGDESASLNTSSPVDIQQSLLSLDADFWSEIFDHSTDYTQNDQYFPPLSSHEEEFFNSSSSESSYDQSALKWIANNEENGLVSSDYNYIDQTVYGDYWSSAEFFASDISNHRSESFIYYDHGMNLFS